MQLLIRFFAGGLIVSLFALIGDVLKPKGFAGLFGAAPSVALATLSLTVASQGKWQAVAESRTMIAGALAFVLYAVCCVYLMDARHVRAAPAALGALIPWAVTAFGLLALFS